jgi:hypothetical protein
MSIGIEAVAEVSAATRGWGAAVGFLGLERIQDISGCHPSRFVRVAQEFEQLTNPQPTAIVYGQHPGIIMKHLAIVVVIGLGVLSIADRAHAAACVNGVYRAGCTGPNGTAVVRKPPPVHRNVTCANGDETVLVALPLRREPHAPSGANLTFDTLGSAPKSAETLVGCGYHPCDFIH